MNERKKKKRAMNFASRHNPDAPIDERWQFKNPTEQREHKIFEIHFLTSPDHHTTKHDPTTDTTNQTPSRAPPLFHFLRPLLSAHLVEHRSHFGSRYKPGWSNPLALPFCTPWWNLFWLLEWKTISQCASWNNVVVSFLRVYGKM